VTIQPAAAFVRYPDRVPVICEKSTRSTLPVSWRFTASDGPRVFDGFWVASGNTYKPWVVIRMSSCPSLATRTALRCAQLCIDHPLKTSRIGNKSDIHIHSQFKFHQSFFYDVFGVI
jgi:hypothetical protein